MEGAAEHHGQGEGPGMAGGYDGTGHGYDRKKREITVGEEPHVSCMCVYDIDFVVLRSNDREQNVGFSPQY